MAKKFIFVNNDGDYEETPGAFEQSDFISSSAGAGDAGKPIVLDVNGQIDSSMINFGAIDHGSLSGLLDDDHTQYILVDGTRAFTGDQDMGANKLTGLAAGTLASDAIRKDQAMLLDGTQAMTADMDLGAFKITNMADGTNATDAVTKQQLDSVSAGLDPKESVRVATTADLGATYSAVGGTGGTGSFSSAPTAIDGVTLANNDRVLVKDQTDAQQNGIYVVVSSGNWERASDQDGTPASEVSGGNFTFVEQGSTNIGKGYVVIGDGILTLNTDDIDWTQFSSVAALSGGDGIDITSNVISVDFLASGGLKFVTGELAVEPNDFAGTGLIDDGADNLAIDFSTTFNDQKAVAAQDLNSTTNGEGASIIGVEDASGYYTGTDVEAVITEIETQIGGTTSTTFDFTENNVLADNDFLYPALEKLDLKWGDLASTANGEGASLVGIEDAGGLLDATTVEAAIQELATDIQDFGTEYTVGAGGVTKGDLVYISSNDTVSTYGTITSGFRVPGIALSTEAAAGTVKVLANDTILTGVLVGATAGDRYYWNGTTLQNTVPSGSGQFVWIAGIARNATDLHVEVQYLKKNA